MPTGPNPSSRGVWIALVVFLLSAAPAMGQEASQAQGAAQIPPLVSFADNSSLAVELSELEDQGLDVLVHNDAGQPQNVTVQVVGLDREKSVAIRQLLSLQPDSQEVLPGRSTSFHIPLGRSTRQKPVEGTYSATIIASGQSGGLARRALEITVPESEQSTPRGNALSPADPIEVTLVAVNYLPSLLSRFNYFLFMTGVVLLFALWVAGGRLRRIDPVLPVAMVAVAVGLIGVLALVELTGDLSGGARIHAISVRPIDVTSDSATGTVGVASSSNGELARLEVADGDLRPQNLDQAATYSGSYDLAPPKDEKGEAKATINVRDFWPFALLTIALGVGIGYILRRWFQSLRPKAKAQVQRDQILALYRASYRASEAQTVGRPYAGLTIEERVTGRLAEVQGLLDEDDLEESNKKLDELRKYIEKFFRLRTALEDLSTAIDELKALWQRQSFGLSSVEELDVVGRAKDLMEIEFDPNDLDPESKELDDSLKRVQDLAAIAREICHILPAISLHLQAAEAALRTAKAGSDDETKLKLLVAKFRELGARALQAETLDLLKAVETEDDTALRDLLPFLPGAPGVEEPPTIDRIRVESEPLLARYFAFRSDSEREFRELMIDGELPETNPEVTISYQIAVEPGSDDPTIHLNDLVSFTIDVTKPPGTRLSALQLEFDDGTTLMRTVPTEDAHVVFVVNHWMESKGRHTLTIRSLPDDVVLATEALTVDAQPRAAVTQARLAADDKMMTRLAALLAISSGLLTLYVGEASWGEPQDYLAALLWGGVTAEGVKLAAALADRVWPAGG